MLNHFRSFWWDKWGKVQNNKKNWAFQIISDHFGGKKIGKHVRQPNWEMQKGYHCKGMEVGDAGFSLCEGLVKTTKSLSAFLSWFISSLLVDD